MTARGIDHVGVTVPDLDAATEFFARAFGAEVLYDTLPRSDGPKGGWGTERRLGVPQGTAEVAVRMLRLPNGPGIELFEFNGPRQGRPYCRATWAGSTSPCTWTTWTRRCGW